MRWIKPDNNDIKVKKKFALLPIVIGNEVRWFEWVTVKYRYGYNEAIYSFSWIPVKFIDKDSK